MKTIIVSTVFFFMVPKWHYCLINRTKIRKWSLETVTRALNYAPLDLDVLGENEPLPLLTHGLGHLKALISETRDISSSALMYTYHELLMIFLE